MLHHATQVVKRDRCDYAQPWYHACRDRHCPKCQWRATEAWTDKQCQAVLPLTYYHLVFTLPHELNAWVQLHPELIYALLFKASAETMQTIAADPNHLGAKIAITSVLHTWGSAMTHHPHVHMIVPGGGLSLDGDKWIVSARSSPSFAAREAMHIVVDGGSWVDTDAGVLALAR